ncbi:hypothetical protein GUJ93_ZPchr0393g29139 [Zizania palustris]|uniref:non-specific serine/threonine protein kinase n=1 Tax=Zizania palustris TaxID=103762 RepID=A0A8J5RDM6_ZIZPA|nr:hypothetical protein GUJ93_ZPchr0393g29139 [Zizania palustris]
MLRRAGMSALALARGAAAASSTRRRRVDGAGGGGGGGGWWNGTCPLDLSYVPTRCCPCSPSASRGTFAHGQLPHPDGGRVGGLPQDFQAALEAPPLSLPAASLVPTCFSPSQFVTSPSYCAGVTTAAQYRDVVGNNSVAALDSACSADLSSLQLCPRCLDAGISATSRLNAASNASAEDPASSNCFYLTVTYAAAISNPAGPTSPPTAVCILGLGLSPPPAAPGRRNTKNKKNHKISLDGSAARQSHPRPNTGSILFDIAELSKATDGFADRNIVGRGGFGAVYRGVLADGSVVAVKKMLDPDMEGGDEEFTNEVEIISHLRHRNLVPLRGCCITDDDVEEGKQRFLVYDFMPNGALEDFIFRDREEGSKRPSLTWAQRRNIIMDVARGLEYLHYGVKPSIYHRDIKATNILLDGEMRARVADFGLARRSREGQSHLTTRVAGTHGYLAPEYALYGQLTEKSDVYSFGVLVLEILSARRVLDMTAPAGPVLITDWAWTLVKAGQAREVLDDALSTAESPRGGTMERFVLVGILCAHVMVALRPTITDAVRMLEGDMDYRSFRTGRFRDEPFGILIKLAVTCGFQ